VDLVILSSDGRRCLSPASTGNINCGFTEICDAIFLKPAGDWNLYVDDVAIAPSRHEGREVWRWRPGFYAGSVKAQLVRPQEKNGIEFLLDVSPDPEKVGQAVFNEMVQDIWDYDPALVIGDEAARTPIGILGEQDEPAVRYMRLAGYAAEFALAMGRVRREPQIGLQLARRNLPLHSVRRADVQTARAAMKGVAALAALDRTNETQAEDSSRHRFYDVPISEPTFDTAANRTLAALVQMVGQAIAQLSVALKEQFANSNADERKLALASRWPRREQVLGDLGVEVRRCLMSEPLCLVTRREITGSGLTAIAANPVYCRAQQVIWKMLRIGYKQGDLNELSAMSPTWAIYEAWCFTQIAENLRQHYPAWSWRRLHYGSRRYGLTGVSNGKQIDLQYQSQFSYSDSPPKSGCWSISATFIPDIILIAKSAQKQSWMVLDAKYRRGRQNVLESMRSAHIYRDALRLLASPPTLSLLLLPGEAEDAPWLHDNLFRENHRVGAIVWSRTRADTNVIHGFLKQFFAA
jgi:hypothetical protein